MTVSRKINREMLVLLGWGRAILLQLAHPAVASVVYEHSGFRGGIGGYARRAHRTVGAMIAITFGTVEEARATVARINRIHARVTARYLPWCHEIQC